MGLISRVSSRTWGFNSKNMGLLEDCKKHFKTTDLYKIFKIEKSSSLSTVQLKKCYYKLALAFHPDKNASKSKRDQISSTAKFQILGKIHKILSMKELYDETGEICEEADLFGKSDESQAWEDYWRTLYPKITLSQIKEFEAEYKYSDEETKDLKEAYIKHKGNLDKIMDSVMCATLDDEDRFVEILNQMILDQEIKPYKAFKNESKKKSDARHKKAADEAEEAIEHAKFLEKNNNSTKAKSKHSGGGDFDLVAMLEKRNAERRVQGEAFLANLEKKYCSPAKKSKINKK